MVITPVSFPPPLGGQRPRHVAGRHAQPPQQVLPRSDVNRIVRPPAPSLFVAAPRQFPEAHHGGLRLQEPPEHVPDRQLRPVAQRHPRASPRQQRPRQRLRRRRSAFPAALSLPTVISTRSRASSAPGRPSSPACPNNRDAGEVAVGARLALPGARLASPSPLRGEGRRLAAGVRGLHSAASPSARGGAASATPPADSSRRLEQPDRELGRAAPLPGTPPWSGGNASRPISASPSRQTRLTSPSGSSGESMCSTLTGTGVGEVRDQPVQVRLASPSDSCRATRPATSSRASRSERQLLGGQRDPLRDLQRPLGFRPIYWGLGAIHCTPDQCGRARATASTISRDVTRRRRCLSSPPWTPCCRPR